MLFKDSKVPFLHGLESELLLEKSVDVHGHQRVVHHLNSGVDLLLGLGGVNDSGDVSTSVLELLNLLRRSREARDKELVTASLTRVDDVSEHPDNDLLVDELASVVNLLDFATKFSSALSLQTDDFVAVQVAETVVLHQLGAGLFQEVLGVLRAGGSNVDDHGLNVASHLSESLGLRLVGVDDLGVGVSLQEGDKLFASLVVKSNLLGQQG